MESKGKGLGLGVVLVAVGALWLLLKGKPAVAAPPFIPTPPIPPLPIPPHIDTGELVTDLVEIDMALNTIGVTPVAPSVIQTPEEHATSIGLTLAEIPAYSAVADQVNLTLGGSYVAGLLTPPSWWTDTVTAWSGYVQDVALIEYERLLLVAPEVTPEPPYEYEETDEGHVIATPTEEAEPEAPTYDYDPDLGYWVLVTG